MTNYEYLKHVVENKEAVINLLCRMVELKHEDEYCDCYCPMAEDCHKGHNGFEAWLNEEHVTPMPDWGRYWK